MCCAEPPDAPTDIKVSERDGRTIRILWATPYSGNSPLTHYVLQHKLETGKFFDMQTIFLYISITFSCPDFLSDATSLDGIWEDKNRFEGKSLRPICPGLGFTHSQFSHIATRVDESSAHRFKYHRR